MKKKMLTLLTALTCVGATSIAYASDFTRPVDGEKPAGLERAEKVGFSQEDLEAKLTKQGLTLEDLETLRAEKSGSFAKGGRLESCEKVPFTQEELEAKLAEQGLSLEEFEALKTEKLASKPEDFSRGEKPEGLTERVQLTQEELETKLTEQGLTLEDLETLKVNKLSQRANSPKF